MALYSASVEYGLHCLLHLVGADDKASSLDLAEVQGVSPSYVAKIFSQLKAAGIVVASEGAQGGYQLARAAHDISVLDVVEALEGHKPLFQCNEVRRQCALFDGAPPAWAITGPCSIHAVMLEAEKKMKQVLASHTLADLSQRVAAKAPQKFIHHANAWFVERKSSRQRSRAQD
jgi:Rrf2 family protein